MLLRQELAAKNNSLKEKNNRIKILEDYILSLKQKQFGSSSEKLSPTQAGLFDEADDAEATPLSSRLIFPRIAAAKDAYRFLPIFRALILSTMCRTGKKSVRMMALH